MQNDSVINAIWTTIRSEIPSIARVAKCALIVAGLLLMVFSVSDPCRAAVTFTKRVSSDWDDAEQRSSNGTMHLNSSDLELVDDGNRSDVTGMRFTSVTIPKGASITNAYIQFQADETDGGSISLTIWGEDSDDASSFTNSKYDITSRPTTSASVPWSPPGWYSVGEAGANQRTPDISAIIQEIVDRFGWSSGNSLVIIITGNGTRTAESYDGSSAAAPLLHVEYSTSAHWKLDETSGTTAADSSGGNTGTVTGTATWTSAVINNGFSFNGSTKIQASDLIGNPSNVTVAAWANLTSADTGGAEVISLGDRFGLRLDEGSLTKAFFWNGSSYESVSVGNTYAGSGWHHFAAVFDDDNNSFTLYVDGVQAATSSTTASISYSGGGSNTVIGRHGNGAIDRDFTGIIDDVYVYTYAMTAAEVAELYGLVGHWRLNETSGSTAADSTIFAENGTVSGGASWSSDCGGMGNFDFNGNSQYISIGNAAHLQPTSMLSIAAWIKGDSWSSGSDVDVILRKGEGNPNNFQLAIADGRATLYLDDSDTNGIRSNTVLSTGQWYHVAATWDGATAKIYIDGQLDNSAARSGAIGTDTRPLYIGGRSGTDYFNGMIRDVRLYNRPLTSAEITSLSGTAGYWPFSEGSGTTAADNSGAGNNATLSGGASWTTDCAGNNSALLTDGAGGIAQTGTFTPPDVGTVAFWMRSSGTPSDTARIFGLGGDWEARQMTDGTLVFDLCGEGGGYFETTEPLDEVGQWYHVAATFDSSDDTYAIYIDGQLHKSGTNGNAMTQQAAAILSFGTRTGSTQYWQGALRDFRIYSRKLCPLEIAELYGLGGHWKLDETSGSVAADSSGLGRNGTVVGSANWTAGIIDNCLQLNGSTRVEINSLMNSPKNVTIAAWANLTSPDPGGSEIVSIGDYFAIRLDNGSVSRAFFYNGSGWTSVSASQTFAGTGWHHFAAVFNDDQDWCKLYIDGVEAASLATMVSIPYSGLGTTTTIGAHGNGSGSFDFTGKIDDVRIYSRALCPGDIQALHDMGNGSFGGVKIIKWVEIQ